MKKRQRKKQFEPATEAFMLAGMGTHGVTMAPLYRRFAVFFVDLVCFSPVLLLTATVYKRMALYYSGIPKGLAWYDALATAFAKWPGLIPGLLVALFTSLLLTRACVTVFAGRTPGMMLMGLRIKNARLAAPSPARIVMREVFAVFSFVVLGAGYIWALFDEAGRPWHDKAAGLFLVSEERPSELAE